MKIGTVVPHLGPLTSPATIVRAARTAEKLGYNSLWLADPESWLLAQHSDRKRLLERPGAAQHLCLSPIAVLAASYWPASAVTTGAKLSINASETSMYEYPSRRRRASSVSHISSWLPRS